ncbi:MAG: L,D-transpeptidase [Cyanobacteria bacterium P01_E01_bin.6]
MIPDRDRFFGFRFQCVKRWLAGFSAASLSVLTIQLPLAAQSIRFTEQGLQLTQQTSLRVLQSAAASSPQRPALPFRVRDPRVPPITPEPGFPTAVLPEPSLNLHLVIRLSERRVFVYRGTAVETSYPIAIGRQGWETPTGRYEVLNMVVDPEWQNPFTGDVIAAGPSNPLGDRWIGFWTDGDNFIGFHGTPNEASVGRAASHGCIRMYNHHVRELFEHVALGTPVIVEH